MAALNESVPICSNDEVSIMGVYTEKTPPEVEEISDIDEDEVPSAVEIASALTIVTPLSASLPQEIVDAHRISFSLPGKAKNPPRRLLSNRLFITWRRPFSLELLRLK